MNALFDIVVYPFLFLALFFEVFLLLAFFEKGARARRKVPTEHSFPSVAVVVPCYNEEKTVGGTVESLLALDYPKEQLSIILVDDGSTDGTARVFETYASDSRVTVIKKENGGKHTALNAGIAATNAEFVGCLDADSFADPSSLKEIMAQFNDEKIGAITAAMSVYAPKSILEHMQNVEYILGIMVRHTLATLNGLYVTPGPLTVFRRKMFQELGGFRSAHNTEDTEIALRMQKAGWKIENAPRARVYTKAPRTVGSLVKQRTRWTSGFIRNVFDYRELFGNPRYGVLGLIVLPLGLLIIYSKLVLLPLVFLQTGQSLWGSLMHIAEVPLSYTLRMSSFSWFFAPVSALSILGIIATAMTIALIIIGAQISDTKMRFGASFLWYFLLYGLIAPLWVIHSIFDVAFGVRRPWRS